MEQFFKKTTVVTITTVALILLAAFIAYKLYFILIQDATGRIRQGVSQGVSEGIGGGIGNAVNPLNIPKRMFGGQQ